MEISETIANLVEYKETDRYKKHKTECWNAVSSGKVVDFSGLTSPEYKYYSELFKLYEQLKNGTKTKEECETAERKLAKELDEYIDLCNYYLHQRKILEGNVKAAEEFLSRIEKAKDQKEIALLACECLGKLTGDTSFSARQKIKIEGELKTNSE